MALLLNADVGEGLDTDDLLYPHLDQASIACGGHTGDSSSMRRAVAMCIEHNVMIGAHPSYPDRDNFGRVSLDLNYTALSESLLWQSQCLLDVCNSAGGKLSYIKPHGALYNDMMSTPALFELVLNVVSRLPGITMLMVGAMPALKTYRMLASKVGIELLAEAFVDRLYLENGALCPRSRPGALLTSKGEITAQAARLIKSASVVTDTGALLDIDAQSLCFHGDNPASIAAIKDVVLRN